MSWKTVGALLVGSIVFLGGCSKTTAPAGTQQATVSLKDGSTFAGTVTSSSPSAITLQAANGESRTYPMTQVSSVQYGQPAAPAAALTPTQASAPPPAAETSAPAMASAPPAAAPAPTPDVSTPAPPPAPVVTYRVVPAGNSITVRTNETIDSKTAAPNQTFSGVVANDVFDADGRMAIPKGSAATLIVRAVEGQGKMQGQSELALDMDSVRVAGRRYKLETTDVLEKGKQGLGKNKRTAKFVGGGAVLGTIIGAVAGGGKGAAIGALSGAGAGTVTQAVTRGKGISVPAETLLTFRLEAPVRIKEVK